MDTSWNLILDNDSSIWIGYCPSLKLSTEGGNLQQVVFNCRELLKKITENEQYINEYKIERV